MAEIQDPLKPRRTDVTYNSYLKVKELTSLQEPLSNPPHHDEMLFIVIHQAYELWFKLILGEMEHAIRYMGEKRVLRAHHFVKRVNEIFKVLVQQIHVLETMAPAEFLKFRGNLMPASGFQSIQFREVEFLAGLKEPRYLSFFTDQPEMRAQLERRLAGPDLRSAYYELLRASGFDFPREGYEEEDSDSHRQAIECLRQIYEKPEEELPLYLLSEALVDFDQYLGLWREHHVRVVERVIGFKKGTGGSSGVSYLRSTVNRKCFPLLWDVRSHLTGTADGY